MRDRLANMVAEIKSSAETIAVASAEISSGNADLASRTESQAGSLEHTARAMDELTGAVRQTWLHGIRLEIDDDAQPQGRLLRRGEA